MFAQLDSSQEFSDAKKFYGSKTPNNLKRIILKRKRAVSEREIFWKRRKKIPCTFIIAKTDLTTCFECELLLLSYDVSVINIRHYKRGFVKKKIQYFSLIVKKFINPIPMSVAKCRGSWVVGKCRGSWVIGRGRGCG